MLADTDRANSCVMAIIKNLLYFKKNKTNKRKNAESRYSINLQFSAMALLSAYAIWLGHFAYLFYSS